MTDFSPPSLALDATTLLSHSAWLAKFARALVANEADIDDVVQQTLATALARPPRHTGNLRGWLGTVAKNVVRSSARSDTARAAREVALPPPPPVESPVEAVARAELRRKVVECVLALDEPYRSTVILRFFEEQEIRAIARLTQSGEDTVRTRLRRGVLRVRELLERRVDEETRGTAHEGVAARALLLSRLRDIAASAGRPSIAGDGGAHGSSAVSRGFGRTAAVQTTRRVLVGAAVVAATGAGWWWWNESHDPALSRDATVASATHPPAPPAVNAPATTTAGVERTHESVAPTPPSPTPPPPPVVKLGTVRGIVSDPEGKPAAGVRVWAIASLSQRSNGTTVEFASAAKAEFEREAAGHGMDNWISATSDEEGRFEFANLTTLPGWEIGAFDPSRGAVVSDVVGFRRGHEEVTVDLRLVRGRLVRGKTRSEDGAPIGNARITLFTTFRGAVTSSEIVAGAYGRSLGEFDAGFRCGDKLEIECSAPGFAGIPRAPIEVASRTTEAALDFCLKRLPGAIVRGRIVSPRGMPTKLEKLLAARFASVPPMDRTRKVSVRAVASSTVDGAAAVEGAGGRTIEGRVDYVENMYDLVVDAGFRGTLELRIGSVVVGSAALVDLGRAPDLVCDPDRLPKLAPSVRFAARFVDAETQEAIDLSKEPYPPQISDGSWIRPTTPADDDLRHGIVHYGCRPGSHTIRSLTAGHAASLFPVVVPEVAAKDPVTLEIPKSDAGIRGTALHPDGRPFERANVTVYRVTPNGLVDASGANLATNAEGEFQFNLLAKGEHVVVVAGPPEEAPGVARVVATAPFTPVEIRTSAGHATRFRIVAGAHDDEPASTRYRILDGDGVVVDDPHRSWTNSTSSFDEFAATLRPGRYVVVVEREGFCDRRLEFDVPAGDTITLALEPLAPPSK